MEGSIVASSNATLVTCSPTLEESFFLQPGANCLQGAADLQALGQLLQAFLTPGSFCSSKVDKRTPE
jgi:hypothetical protein